MFKNMKIKSKLMLLVLLPLLAIVVLVTKSINAELSKSNSLNILNNGIVLSTKI